MRIAIVLFEGVEELDAVGPYEVLRSAEQLGGNFSTTLVSAGGEHCIRTFYGMEICNLPPLSMELQWDVFIVPGGGWLSGQQTGIRRMIREEVWQERLRQLHAKGTVIVGICSGVFLLGAAGLLHDRAATTHHAAWTTLNNYGAKPLRKRVVDTGSIITAGGIASGIDVAFWLIERFLGSRLAKQTEEHLEYRRQGHVVKIPCPSVHA
ncbi:MAG: AraC family transcriptional regulator [Verrucomicrobia bacterium]|nr:MAG: AraC family transcriptional regulator [Verrucomicrobiota bacterium]